MNLEYTLFDINRNVEGIKAIRKYNDDYLSVDYIQEFVELMDIYDIEININWDEGVDFNDMISIVENEKKELKHKIIQFLTFFKEELNDYDDFIEDDELYYNSDYDYSFIIPKLLKYNICTDILNKYNEKIDGLDEDYFEEQSECSDVIINGLLYNCYYDCVERICSL